MQVNTCINTNACSFCQQARRRHAAETAAAADKRSRRELSEQQAFVGDSEQAVDQREVPPPVSTRVPPPASIKAALRILDNTTATTHGPGRIGVVATPSEIPI